MNNNILLYKYYYFVKTIKQCNKRNFEVKASTRFNSSIALKIKCYSMVFELHVL